MERRDLIRLISPIYNAVVAESEVQIHGAGLDPARVFFHLTVPKAQEQKVAEIARKILRVRDTFEHREPMYLSIVRVVELGDDDELDQSEWEFRFQVNREPPDVRERAESQVESILDVLIPEGEDAWYSDDDGDDELASIPRTISAAVAELRDQIEQSALEALRSLPEDELHELDFSLGMAIRNSWLWVEGSPLMEAGREILGRDAQPDDVSVHIIRQLWTELQNQ